MKLYTLLAVMLPLSLFAQTKDHYEQAMQKFQNFYNAGQGDSINAMFGHGWDEMKLTKPLWTNDEVAEAVKNYGYLKSFKFIGTDSTDQKVYVFKTVFSKKGIQTTSLNLDSDNNLATFRFITTSEGIVKLLRKNAHDSPTSF